MEAIRELIKKNVAFCQARRTIRRGTSRCKSRHFSIPRRVPPTACVLHPLQQSAPGEGIGGSRCSTNSVCANRHRRGIPALGSGGSESKCRRFAGDLEPCVRGGLEQFIIQLVQVQRHVHTCSVCSPTSRIGCEAAHLGRRWGQGETRRLRVFPVVYQRHT